MQLREDRLQRRRAISGLKAEFDPSATDAIESRATFLYDDAYGRSVAKLEFKPTLKRESRWVATVLDGGFSFHESREAAEHWIEEQTHAMVV